MSCYPSAVVVDETVTIRSEDEGDVQCLGVFDGDDEGTKIVNNIKKRLTDETEVAHRCRTHLKKDIEEQLVFDGLGDESREVMTEIGTENAHSLSNQKLVLLMGKKVAVLTEFSAAD